jgi:hypothetical protein
MDGYVVHGGMAMARGAFVRIEDGRGMLFYVWDGELWITQEGDRQDHLVRAGRWFRLDRGGAALACATRDAHVTLTAPVPAYYARRVIAGPRVIYDRRREQGGWLQSVGMRLARRWANAFVPGARPTTAAL